MNVQSGGLASLVAALLLAVTLPGCGLKAISEEEAAKPPTHLLAVAPLENRSNFVEAAEEVQSAFALELTSRGWNVLDTEGTNERLRDELGINYGGQLGATTPQEVCRLLKVEGVFYGEVLDWGWLRTYVYNSHTVMVAFRLFRKDGTLAWEGKPRKGWEARMLPIRQKGKYEYLPTQEDIEEMEQFMAFLRGEDLKSVAEAVRKVANDLPPTVFSVPAEPSPAVPVGADAAKESLPAVE